MRFFKWCQVLILFVISTSLLFAEEAGATSVRWDGVFGIESKEMPVKAKINIDCDRPGQAIVLSTGMRLSACVYGEVDTFRVAGFVSEGRHSYAVSSPYETAFRSVGVCRGVSGCVYSSEYDILIEPYNEGVRVYEDFSNNSSAVSSSNFLFQAHLDVALPEVALSQNGRWLGIFTPGVGYSRVDLKDQSLIRLTSTSDIAASRYRLAISNDGLTLAAAEDNKAFIIYAEDCGIYVELGSRRRRGGGGGSECKRSDAINHLFSYQRQHIEDISFSSDDTRLRFNAKYAPTQNIYTVVFRAGEAPSVVDVKYFALGDSFSSGEGETDRSMYINGTDTEINRCHVSSRSYPYLLSDYWGVEGFNVACSGAVMKDLIGSSLEPGQLKSVTQDTHSVISIGVGGNDAGLMSKLSTCLMPDTCEWASESGRARTAKELQGLYTRYVGLFQKILDTHPKSSVIAVSYPMPIEAKSRCSIKVSLLLNEQERRYIVSTIGYLNMTMEAAASKFGIGFADVEDAYVGHRICESAAHPAMNFIRFGNDIAPFLGIKIIGSESLHPTPFGHELVFNRIASQLPEYPVDIPSCIYCGQTADEVPEPPKELGVVDDSTPVVVYKKTIVKDSFTPGEVTTIKIPEGMFMKGSTVNVVIRSKPKLLAADVLTGGEVEVVMPEEYSGSHTIVIAGTTEGGESLELYKSIYITPNASEVVQPEHVSSNVYHKDTPRAPDEVFLGLGGATAVYEDTTSPAVLGEHLQELEEDDLRTPSLWLPTLILALALVAILFLAYRYLRR